jgi:arylesterase/paraoxonase
MPGLASKFTVSVLVVLFAIGYQIELHRLVLIIYGRGRVIEPLSAFPYKCRRIHHERLMSCEDMWLSESTRQLFLACSEPSSREHWAPP